MPVVSRSSTARWVLACAAAEAVGMTAASGAARMADDAMTPDSWGTPTTGLGIIVVGGLVEGLALGGAQGLQLRARLPDLHLARFVLATLFVAGVGWAAASAPATLGEAGAAANTAPPPLPLVLLGAGAIGLVMGCVLGGCQSLVLRHVAVRPARWLLANVLAWPPAMVVIFFAASTAGAAWSVATLMAYGALTGAAAGTVLGLITVPFLLEPPKDARGDENEVEEEIAPRTPSATERPHAIDTTSPRKTRGWAIFRASP